MSQNKYPPYVNAYGNLSKLLGKIRIASVPSKVTNDYISTVLGLKSSSYRATIPLLKKLGFLDSASVPTQRYKDFRSDRKSGFILAKSLKDAYADLYQAHEYVHKLDKNDLTDIVATVTGASKDDSALKAVVGTFLELVKHASFDVEDIPDGAVDDGDEDSDEIDDETISDDEGEGQKQKLKKTKFGISYTVNLNLPATTEVKVFDAIFKSLRKHILDE